MKGFEGDECAPEHGCDVDLVFPRKEGIAELLSLAQGRLNDPIVCQMNTTAISQRTHLYLPTLLK